ncbi:tyrosine-type recombinase/integrase [Thalassotalea eurytherma]|uniref:Tyr recombinase domain-containing protein n=1 Tax=Thalassotalea eurytherma TaxID=1144278 RepID=A0ABQ6H1S7_9GAMM|nr:site-specific integrase [Thalassotalea eurytherma]GLX81854.1 hypothetical protein theurythT_13060 [Thalassotalea eurytherma]
MTTKKIKYETVSSRYSYSLIDSNLGRIDEYSQYLESKILDKAPQSTINAIANDLKVFYDYILAFEDLQELSELLQKEVLKTPLNQIISQYPEYLVNGKHSPYALASYASKKNNRKGISVKSSERYIASANQYLKYSETIQSELLNLSDKGLVDINLDSETLLDNSTLRRELAVSEKKSILANSMLANVVRGGAKYMAQAAISVSKMHKISSGEDSNVEVKAFPVEFLLDTINASKTYRDRCFWSLLAGTGIRTSEAVQTLMQDIDPEVETIKIKDPTFRMEHYSFLDKNQLSSMAFKSRQTEKVWFLEPFKSIFFLNLQKYLLEERPQESSSHSLFFVSLANNTFGKTLIGSTELNPTFKEAQRKAGMNKTFTLHSLRHFYGMWCRNYIKNPDGSYGWSESTVQVAMGHASRKSTKIYAQKDKKLMSLALKYANEFILGASPELTVDEVAYLFDKYK